MSINYLEIYPTETGCVQGCSHCFRSQGAQRIDSISQNQRDIIDGVLSFYTARKKKKGTPLHVNLSGNIENYGFQLFEDVGNAAIDRMYFSIGSMFGGLGVFQNLDSIFQNLLGINSGEDIELIVNATMNGGEITKADREAVRGFLYEYFKFVQNSQGGFFNSSAALASLGVNNLHMRQVRDLDIDTVMNSFFLAHKDARINHEFALGKRHNFEKQGMYTLESDVYGDKFATQVNVRMILAKRAKKQGPIQALQEAISEGEFLVSIFPDTVMIHHSTETIHIQELYFSYDEFFDILQESRARFRLRRRGLDGIVTSRLQERLRNLQS